MNNATGVKTSYKRSPPRQRPAPVCPDPISRIANFKCGRRRRVPVRVSWAPFRRQASWLPPTSSGYLLNFRSRSGIGNRRTEPPLCPHTERMALCCDRRARCTLCPSFLLALAHSPVHPLIAALLFLILTFRVAWDEVRYSYLMPLHIVTGLFFFFAFPVAYLLFVFVFSQNARWYPEDHCVHGRFCAMFFFCLFGLTVKPAVGKPETSPSFVKNKERKDAADLKFNASGGRLRSS